jgi:hypothetical protein
MSSRMFRPGFFYRRKLMPQPTNDPVTGDRLDPALLAAAEHDRKEGEAEREEAGTSKIERNHALAMVAALQFGGPLQASVVVERAIQHYTFDALGKTIAEIAAPPELCPVCGGRMDGRCRHSDRENNP